jgi:hypothetical protein
VEIITTVAIYNRKKASDAITHNGVQLFVRVHFDESRANSLITTTNTVVVAIQIGIKHSNQRKHIDMEQNAMNSTS